MASESRMTTTTAAASSARAAQSEMRSRRGAGARGPAAGGWGPEPLAPDPRLEIPDRPAGRDALPGEADQLDGVGVCEERPGMPLRELAAPETLLDFGGEPEQPERVAHGRAVLPHQPGDLLLGQREIGHEPLVAGGRVHRRKIVALEILDQREGEQRAVLHLLHHRRELLPAEALHRAPAPLAGDQLVAAAGPGSAHDGLQEKRGGDRIGQLLELPVVELASRLIRVRADRGNGQLPERPGGLGALSCDRSEERLQAAAQSLRFGHELTFLVSGMFGWGSGISAVSSPDSALRSSSWATER